MKLRQDMKYKTLIFDCDGVLLDSNSLKTEAFRTVAADFGAISAQRLVDYHLAHGGISRYEKFRYFIDSILRGAVADAALPSIEDLLMRFSSLTRTGFEECSVAEGLPELREKTKGAFWLVLSGSDQTELRSTLASKGLADYFDKGIFGSPRSKEQIVEDLLSSGEIVLPAVFFGDSKYDFQVAAQFGFDFVFVSGWSEVSDWPEMVKENNLAEIHGMRDLLDQKCNWS